MVSSKLLPQDGSKIKLRFLDMAMRGDTYFVATNQGILLTGNILVQGGDAHCNPIRVSDECFVQTTSVTGVTDHPDALLVGMSDGSVKLLLCPPKRLYNTSLVPTHNQRTTKEEVKTGGDSLMGAKSCAIQNIIKDERRDSDPTAIQSGQLVDGDLIDRGTDLLELWNQVYLLHGHTLKGRQVTWIQQCPDTSRVYALCGKSLRQFDMDTMVEIYACEKTEIEAATIVNSATNGRQMVN